jgi:hypothetical protein
VPVTLSIFLDPCQKLNIQLLLSNYPPIARSEKLSYLYRFCTSRKVNSPSSVSCRYFVVRNGRILALSQIFCFSVAKTTSRMQVQITQPKAAADIERTYITADHNGDDIRHLTLRSSEHLWQVTSSLNSTIFLLQVLRQQDCYFTRQSLVLSSSWFMS